MGSSRPQQRGRSAVMEGVYNNVHFMHAVASQIGNVVQIQTKSGAIFEGIFYTVSPHFEIVLQLVHRIEDPNVPASLISSPSNTSGSSPNDYSISNDSVFDVLIFKPNDVVYFKAKDADLDYATKDTFQTDTVISKCNGSRLDEKELEPWQFDEEKSSLNGDEISLELDNNANGWDVNDMFSFNEQRYGVQSTFDQSLSGYTIQIQKIDTQDFRDAEEQAEKIAHEIESQPAYKERTDIENGDENEEAKFAAVERPQSDSPDEIKAGKYVAPGRRKQHNTQAGKLIRPSQLNVSSNNASSSASSASSTSSTSSVPSTQLSCNNKFSLPQHSLPQQSTQKNTASSQQTPIHRLHNQPNMQQVNIHKVNGEEENASEVKHSHHRRHRSDVESERGEKLDRDRIERVDSRENRDSRERENREKENTRENKSGLQMLHRGGIRHYASPAHINQTGNLNAYAEISSNSNSNNQIATSPNNTLTPTSHQTIPHNISHQAQVRLYSNSPLMGQDNQTNASPHLYIQSQQAGPPPQPQRQRIQRDEQTADFRKFKQNFMLNCSKGQRANEQSQMMNHSGSLESKPHDENTQNKSFTKTFSNQKQFVNQSAEPNPTSSTNERNDGEKRPNQPCVIQQEQTIQSYVSVVQQQSSPQAPQQQTQKSLISEVEKLAPNNAEAHIDYQIPVSISSKSQHVINPNGSSTNNSPAISIPQITNNNESLAMDKQQAPKKYTLNPAAKPFTPRIPVTPNSSRPHTPQTPGTQSNAQSNTVPLHPPQQSTPQPPQIPGQHVSQGPVMTMAYFVQQPQQTYPTSQHAQQTIAYSGASLGLRKPAYDRKNPLPVSQVQVAAAASAVTGAPLHVATPMTPYISHYPQAHPQSFPGPYAQMVLNRYPENPHQPQPLQYLTATPPSTTPSPGQPHQQFHQGPQTAGTTQYAQAPQQFQVIPVMNGPPVVATPYMQPPNSGPFLLMQPHPQQ